MMYYDNISKLFQDGLNKSNVNLLADGSTTIDNVYNAKKSGHDTWLINIHNTIQQISSTCSQSTINNIYAVLFELYRSKDPIIIKSCCDIKISNSKMGLIIEFPSYGIYCDIISDDIEVMVVNKKITIEKIKMKDLVPKIKKVIAQKN